MKAAWIKEKSLTIVMVLAALLLAGVLAWEWQQVGKLESVRQRIMKTPVTPIPALKILPEFHLPDAQTGFPEMLARPLFSVTRTPAAVPGKEKASAMKKGQFILAGVVITPNQRSALLRDVESGKTERVIMGEEIRGLTLGEVEADRVVLRLAGESEEIPLKVLTAVKQPTPAVPRVMPNGAQPFQAAPRRDDAPPATNAAPPPAPSTSPPTAPSTAPSEAPKPGESGLGALNAKRAKYGLPPL